jgi:antitoxin VapB
MAPNLNDQSRAKAGLIDFLERSVCPKVVPGALGHPITREEEDSILGYGPEGF